MKTYWVYMLRCSDGSYYIGVTSSIEQRLAQHETGSFPGCYTFDRRPLECIYSAEFGEITDAIHWEKQIKRWSRKKKEALILNAQKELEFYSRSEYRKRIDRIRDEILQRTINKLCRPSSSSG